MLSILRIFHVIISLRSSTLSDSILARISYAPKIPCTSFTPSIDFSLEITDSSVPNSQFLRTYASAIINLGLFDI